MKHLAIEAFGCILFSVAALQQQQQEKKPVLPLRLAQNIAISPDGATLAIAETKGSIRLWDVFKNEGKHAFSIGNWLDSGVGMSFSPNGEKLCITTFPDRLEIWDVRKG